MNNLDFLKLITLIANSKETLDCAKLRANAFMRKRKMLFTDALSVLLDMRKTTLQTRLNLYFKTTKGGDPISQQAFSKLRMNFDHSPFETMVRVAVKKEYSGEYELPLWQGYHVVAVDGSYLQLPRADELRQEFGTRGGGRATGNQPSAGVSVLYDVLHGWPLDPIITHTAMNERTECMKHICFLCKELPHIAQKSILTIDRGYSSLGLFQSLQSSGLKFVARCSTKSTSQITNSPVGESVVMITSSMAIRVVKFELPSGEIETLVTNLFELPWEQITELYAIRWGVEMAYFRLKRELSVEKFSGKTPNAIRQDFWASMVLMQAVAVFQKEANETVQQRQKSKSVKHHNRARTSDLIITLRDRFIFAVLCNRPMFCAKEMEEVIKTMARAVSPVRPGRSFGRSFRPSDNVEANLKSRL